MSGLRIVPGPYVLVRQQRHFKQILEKKKQGYPLLPQLFTIVLKYNKRRRHISLIVIAPIVGHTYILIEKLYNLNYYLALK